MRYSNVISKIFMILGIICVGLLIYTRVNGNVKRWNKDTGIDVHQEFTRAYLVVSNGNTKVYNVKSWRDFDHQDQIQFTTDDNITILTHSSRVILTNEK